MKDYKPDHVTLSPKRKNVPVVKEKRETFVSSIPKLTAYVPPVGKYTTTWNWSDPKQDPKHTQRIVKGPVNSYLD